MTMNTTSPLNTELHSAEAPSHSSISAIAKPANKPRSGSAPAMSSPPRIVPSLSLSSVSTSVTSTSGTASHQEKILGSTTPILKSVTDSPRSSKVRFIDPTGSQSSSAPSTPHKTSPRPVDEFRSPERNAIKTTPRKRTGSGAKDIDKDIHVPVSPRHLDSSLVNLGDEAAKLIFSEMKAKNPILTNAIINQFGRGDTPITLKQDRVSAQLLKLIDDGSGKTTHAKLIKALFLKTLVESPVGKTLLAMRATVMQQYDGDTLTLVDREMHEGQHPGFKHRLQMNIEDQGKACAAVTLGLDTPDIRSTALPPELIALWKAMDGELCIWAASNPALTAADLKKARANLGFDLLFTRLMLPLASGSKNEAELAIPSMFFASVKNALLAGWPKFVDSFIASVDAKHKPIDLSVATALKASTTSSASTTTTYAANVLAQSGAGADVGKTDNT